MNGAYWLRHVGLIAVLPVVSGILGYALVLGPLVNPSPSEEQAWEPPQAGGLTSYVEADYRALRSWKGWGSSPAAQGARAETEGSSRWRLVGIVSSPTPVAIISLPGDSAIRHIARGELLPDGRRLMEVMADRILVEDGTCAQQIALYTSRQAGSAKAPSGAECSPAATLESNEEQ
ncbi:MAG: hypothetical protein HYV16_15975 [Gammaproteobacteria bacterium]|nr:hypothetical protein [Gammaproteobacteria bacterium]